jgi:hypothetical protein
MLQQFAVPLLQFCCLAGAPGAGAAVKMKEASRDQRRADWRNCNSRLQQGRQALQSSPSLAFVAARMPFRCKVPSPEVPLLEQPHAQKESGQVRPPAQAATHRKKSGQVRSSTQAAESESKSEGAVLGSRPHRNEAGLRAASASRLLLQTTFFGASSALLRRIWKTLHAHALGKQNRC